jgi:predicted  nucleic acid-binding Zn-ribbon protein
VEQVTKEKFLRAVVGDPPLYILASENAALESHLLSVKASLKAQKTEVADLVTELEAQGRDLCQRYQEVQLQRTQLESLPEHIAGLERTIETLRNAAEPKSNNPVLTLPLPRTLEVLSAKEDESARLDEELLAMRGVTERKQRELAQLQNELGSLQAQKTRATTEMADARTRKAEGISGLGDDLEQRGRWLRGVEITLRSMLEAVA